MLITKPVAVSLNGASLNPGIRVKESASYTDTLYFAPFREKPFVLVGGFLSDAEGRGRRVGWLWGADLESLLIGGASFFLSCQTLRAQLRRGGAIQAGATAGEAGQAGLARLRSGSQHPRTRHSPAAPGSRLAPSHPGRRGADRQWGARGGRGKRQAP